jgi:GWxTD domain-containing protein
MAGRRVMVVMMGPSAVPGGRGKTRAGTALWALLLFLLLAAASACRLYRLERQLSPAYADFLSKVQYIMTREERKIFLELPDSEKGQFINDFWERRNPDPDSENNAFKMEYYDRVRNAENLFRGEGRPGYLTDRGRIFILFGPPSERQTYPVDGSGYCREVWYYGGFPVIFIDEHCQGQFILTAINLEHLQALNIAQGRFQKTFEQDKKFFDYSVEIAKGRTKDPASGRRAVIDVPYAGIWFDFKDARLKTVLDVRVEVRDGSGRRVWEHHGLYALDLGEDELKAKSGKSYRVEVPLDLDEESGRLRGQRLALHVSVRSRAGDEELKKVLEFRLEP